MADTPHVFDITVENFAAVLEEYSPRVPVLVDFWAPWCGPCKALLPLLQRLAGEYAGQFILAKVNIDEQPALAQQFGVRSVPTVKVFRHARLVDEFLGAQPEAEVRRIIERHIERESDRILAAAQALHSQGDTTRAAVLMRDALAKEPDNAGLCLALAEMQMEEGNYEESAALLESLPAEAAFEPEAAALLARLEFAQAVKGAPSEKQLEQTVANAPDDSRARYQLAAYKVLAGDYEGAMDHLLGLMRRDRGYGDDAGIRHPRRNRATGHPLPRPDVQYPALKGFSPGNW